MRREYFARRAARKRTIVFGEESFRRYCESLYWDSIGTLLLGLDWESIGTLLLGLYCRGSIEAGRPQAKAFEEAMKRGICTAQPKVAKWCKKELGEKLPVSDDYLFPPSLRHLRLGGNK